MTEPTRRDAMLKAAALGVAALGAGGAWRASAAPAPAHPAPARPVPAHAVPAHPAPAHRAPARPAAARTAPPKDWPAAPGDMSLGKPTARVHVVEYLSLSCPHCAHFHATVFPAFKAKYIDTGRVYFTIRELLTAPANVAAAGFLMARCNGGAHYFDIVDQVFQSQARWREGDIKPIFVEIAKANGITEPQFDACLTDDAANAALQARIEYATSTDKVTGTPTFFVNGVRLPNQTVPTLPDLDRAIARALKRAAAVRPAPSKGRR